MLNTSVEDDKHCSEVSSMSITDVMLAVVKQEPPDETVVQWSPAAEATVKDEPPDDTEDSYWESDGEDRPPILLIDIVKCESTLIQTLDDGLTIAQYRVEDAPPPVLLCRNITQKNIPYESKSLTRDVKSKIRTRNDTKSLETIKCSVPITKYDQNAVRCKVKSYKCEKCDVVLRGTIHFEKHMRIYHTVKSFRCNMCDKAYYYKSNLNRHICMAHKNMIPFKCGLNSKISKNKLARPDMAAKIEKYKCAVCNKVLSRTAFYRHRRLHADKVHKAAKHKCVKCDRAFIRKSHLESHMNAHRGRIKYKCDACSLTFVRPSDLFKHNSDIHSGKTDLVTFGKCNKKKVVNKKAPIEKINQNLEKEMIRYKNLFKCNKCGRLFNQSSNLRRHLITVHHKIKPFKCGVCNWNFGQKRNLDSHMKLHRKIQIKCGKCKKIFLTISDLNQHTLRFHGSKVPKTPTNQHNALMKFKCDLCNLGFLRISDLSKHRLKHVEAEPSRHSKNKQILLLIQEPEAKILKNKLESENKPRNLCKCNICGRMFPQMYNLKRHLLNVHGTRDFPKNTIRQLEDNYLKYRLVGAGSRYKNKFKCNKCDGIFTHIANLKRHVKIVHYNIKPFKCGICDKVFGQRAQRDKHMKLHNTTKQHKCRQCKSEFDTKSALNQHTTKIHRKNKLKNMLNVLHKKETSNANSRKISTQKVVIKNSKKTLTKKVNRPINLCKCKKCGRVFTQNYSLKRHMLTIHLNMKLFKCGICDLAFGQKKTRDQHMRAHGTVKEHKCDKCKFTFNTTSDLEKHMLQSHIECESLNVNVHEGRIQYKCEECHLEFTRPTDLSKHKLTHNKKRKLKKIVRKTKPLSKCSKCGRLFTQIYNLKRHMKNIHSSTKPFKCKVCYRTFEQKIALDRHEKLHSTTKQHKCDRCQMAFFSKSGLQQHLKKHFISTMTGENMKKTVHFKPHEKGSMQKCKFCNKLFGSNVSMSNHMRTHKNANILQCMICKKVLKTVRILRAHMRMHAENGQHKCSICNQVLGSKYTLSRHLMRHKTIGEKVLLYKMKARKHRCGICGKIFALKAHLETHVKAHNAPEQHKCGVCNMTFLRSSDLAIHALQHNGTTPTKCKSSLQCSICFKKLGSKRSLHKHKMAHYEADKYKCNICDKKFARKDGLKRHSLTHTREYKCDQCNKKFKSKSDLNIHRKMHHFKEMEDKKYRCPICYKAYTLKKCLDKHIKSHKEWNNGRIII